jgi:hypothetical protein
MLVESIPRRAHRVKCSPIWFICTIAIVTSDLKLTSVSQTGRVIGKGQQMKILITGALIVLDLAIIGYILRQVIEMISVWS